MTRQRQLKLNAFLMSTGHHEASWRLPESNPTSNTTVIRSVDCEVACRFSVMITATRVPEISRVSHTSRNARPPIEAMISASDQVR